MGPVERAQCSGRVSRVTPPRCSVGGAGAARNAAPAKHESGPSALEREGDPRGLQDETYRTADPRDVVESEGTASSYFPLK